MNPLHTLWASAVTLSAILCLDVHGVAQVPRGWAVISSHQNGASSLGGLTLVHPTRPGQGIPITGLPVGLTGTPSSSSPNGAASVLVDRDGHLVVGEHAPAGQSTDIHVLTLSGTTVIADQAYPIGTSTTGGCYIDQMAWLGDDIVFTVRGGRLPSTSPFFDQVLGILRPYLGPPGTPGTVTVVPVTTNPPGTVNALTVDASTGTAWFGEVNSNATSSIYGVPVPGNGVTPVAPTLLITLGGDVRNLGLTNEGHILLATSTYLAEVDPLANPVTATTLCSGSLGIVNGLAVETATGDLLVADHTNRYASRLAGCVSTGLAPVPGIPNGVAIRPALETYGAPSGCGAAYEWQIAPNPGGLPLVGNAGFSITMQSAAATGTSLVGVVASLGNGAPPASTPLPPYGTLLVSPTTMALLGWFSDAPSVTVPFAIPASPGFAGLDLFFQSAHVVPCGFGASDGLWLTM